MHEQSHDSGIVTDSLARILGASRAAGCVRVCLLTTRDRDHALGLVREAAMQAGAALHHVTVAGRRRYDGEARRWEIVGTETTDAFQLLRRAGEIKEGGIVALEDCASCLRDEAGDVRMRMLLSQMLSSEQRSSGMVLVFLEGPDAEARLPSILAPQFVRLGVPYPRAHELALLAREEIARSVHRTSAQMDVDSIRAGADRLAPGLVGLTLSAARDALRDALVPNPVAFAAAAERLDRRKAEHLGRELAMRILDTEKEEEPVGLDYLMEFLAMARPRMRKMGPSRARGVLLVGPPGTGKTMLARAVGRIVGLPVVEFRISSLMNSLLGETERRFAQAFATLEAMSPNVVFIDEIEKAFGDSSERDGGTMMRVTGSLLSWLSDNPHPNFIVATSNNLDRMGEIGLTMTRSERFDAAFFVDLPGESARRCMLERWLEGVVEESATVASELAAATDRFSGADLRSLVKNCCARAEHYGVAVTADLLRQESDRKRMRALKLYEDFSNLRDRGRVYCEPAGASDE